MSLNVEGIVGMDVGDNAGGFLKVRLGVGVDVGVKICAPGGRVGPAARSARDSSSGTSGDLRPSQSCPHSPCVTRRLILVGKAVHGIYPIKQRELQTVKDSSHGEHNG